MLWQIALGAGLGAGTLIAASIVGLHRDRALYATLLAAIAVFYVVFAAPEGGARPLVLQTVIASVFVVSAMVGYRAGGPALAAGLAAHGVYDLAAHAFGGPAPHWWAGLCLGIDGVLAIGAWRYLRGIAPHGPRAMTRP